MSTVTFRVDQGFDYGSTGGPSVLAQIIRLDSGGRAVRGTTMNRLVPISARSDDALSLELDEGTYSVQVRLPTGEVLAEAVTLRDGERRNVVLQADPVPQGWLAWQHLAGNAVSRGRAGQPVPESGIEKVESALASMELPMELLEVPRYVPTVPPTRDSRDDSSTYPAIRRDPVERIGLELSEGRMRPSSARNVPVLWSVREPSRVTPARAILWLERRLIAPEDEFLYQNPWETLPAIEGATENIIAGLRVGSFGCTVHSVQSDELNAVFDIPSGRGRMGSRAREFAMVRRRMGVELICLPGSWAGEKSGRLTAVEVGVRRPRLEHEFASSVVVRDQQLAVLLGFLASGDFLAVSQLAEQSQVMLREKGQNPLAAAAGGYALVGSATDLSPQVWHRWIENLMTRFSSMPDGAIQYGMMRLRLRSSRRDVREAAEAFKEAYRRGLPLFGMGVRWLLDGLDRTSMHDDEAASMAAAVRRVASRLHPQSAITIIRVGKR